MSGHETHSERRRPAYIVARVCVVLIIAIWLAAAVSKFYDLPDFTLTVQKHGVLGEQWQWLALLVAPLEILIALLLIFAVGSELTKLFGRLCLVLSLLGIIGFAWYLAQVPDVVLQESGCGCGAATGIAAGMNDDVRLIATVRTAVLVVLHVVALGQPLVMKPERVGTEEGAGSDD